MLPQLLRFLDSKLPDALALLEQMVGINSFTANGAGVNELGVLTARAFSPLGFAADAVPSEYQNFGQHLFLRRPGRGNRRLVLVTHLDTVYPPDEEARHDFRWRPSFGEGRIYGPGTVDIKGGTAMIWLVLHALAEFAPEAFLETEWLIAANASEEVLSDDFAQRAIERSPGGADAVLVFEGGAVRPSRGSDTPIIGAEVDHRLPSGHRFTLVTARKGKADYRISVSGRGAHAGSYHAEGRNAIVALADCVQKAAALTDYSRQLTVNVGNVRGGTVVNRVPHEAAADLEMRAFDPVLFSNAKSAIESLAGDSAAVPGARILVTKIGETQTWPQQPNTLAVLQQFSTAAESMGGVVIPEHRGGLSDANYLYALGPTLDGLGPSGGNSHCSERSDDGSKIPEYVEVGSFIPKAALSVVALMEMTKPAPGK